MKPETKELIERLKIEPYGQEVVVDMNEVPIEAFTEANLREFAADLCDEIGMRKGPIHVWGGDEDLGTFADDPKKDGFSVVQFLWESSITIHALDLIQKVFINVFSCKEVDQQKVEAFALKRLGGRIVASTWHVRQ